MEAPLSLREKRPLAGWNDTFRRYDPQDSMKLVAAASRKATSPSLRQPVVLEAIVVNFSSDAEGEISRRAGSKKLACRHMGGGSIHGLDCSDQPVP